MNWFVLAILSGLFFAASRVISRAILKVQGNALAFTAINDFVAGLVLIPFVFNSLRFPEQPVTWIYFSGIVVFAFLSDWLAFLALKRVDVSLYQIINQARHVFILVGGLLFFMEIITVFKVAGIGLITAGVILAMYEKSKLVFNRGAWLTLLSTFAAVAAFLMAKAAVNDFSETTAASLELIVIGLLSFGLLRFQPRKIVQELKIQRWGIILSGALFGAFEVLLFSALKNGEASRVVPVTQVSLIFAVAAGVIFLKERARLWQKLIGLAVIGAGIALIY